jgi:hypothetical protein
LYTIFFIRLRLKFRRPFFLRVFPRPLYAAQVVYRLYVAAPNREPRGVARTVDTIGRPRLPDTAAIPDHQETRIGMTVDVERFARVSTAHPIVLTIGTLSNGLCAENGVPMQSKQM